MAQKITITVPDNCELKQDGNTYTIVEKEKKLTYEDIVEKLFGVKTVYWINKFGGIDFTDTVGDSYLPNANNASTKKQLEKLLAINKLMNVAKYLNGDWQPDWNNEEEGKFYIENVSKNLNIDCTGLFNSDIVYFKSEELAEQAIEILGEKTIKLALCTDY